MHKGSAWSHTYIIVVFPEVQGSCPAWSQHTRAVSHSWSGLQALNTQFISKSTSVVSRTPLIMLRFITNYKLIFTVRSLDPLDDLCVGWQRGKTPPSVRLQVIIIIGSIFEVKLFCTECCNKKKIKVQYWLRSLLKAFYPEPEMNNFSIGAH